MKNKLVFLFALGIVISCNSSKSSFTDRTSTLAWSADIEYSGGKGTSYEDAIIIKNAKSSYDGIPAEYAYMSANFGKRGTDWNSFGQSLEQKNNKYFDVINIVKQKDTIDVYFDITEFYGKF